MREESRDPLHSSADIHRLEDFLLLVRRRVHEGRDHIGERARRFDALDGRQQFVGRLRQELDGLDRLAFEMDETGLDLDPTFALGSGILSVLATKNGQPVR